MAISERLAYILEFDTKGGVKSLEKLGKSADKELGKVDKKLDKIGTNLTKFGVGAVAFAGVAGAALFKMAGKASDLEESVNAVVATFGDAADSVLKLGENSARSFGLSKSAFNSFAVQFSAFAKQIATKDGRAVADVLSEITTRTADFASLQNLELAQAGQIVMSTLAGETEAFRRYGGDVSAATVKTFAYKEGIAEVGNELTESEKILARYGLLMEQTAVAHGDFAATADGAANSERIMRAELTNMAAEIGAGALPAFTKLIGIVREVVGGLGSLNTAMDGQLGTVATYGVALLGAAGGISFMSGQIIKARSSIKAFTASLTVAKSGMIGVGAVLTAAFIIYDGYNKKKQEARERTDEFVSALQREEKGVEGATDELIIQKLAAGRTREAIEDLGVSTADLALFIQGKNIPAIQALIDASDKWGGSAEGFKIAQRELGLGAEANAADFLILASIVNDLKAAHAEAAVEVAAQESATADLTLAKQEAAEAEGVLAEAVELTTEEVQKQRDGMALLASGAIKKLNAGYDDTGKTVAETQAELEALNEEFLNSEEAIDGVTGAFADLKGELSDRSAELDMEDAMIRVREATEAVTAAVKEHGEGSLEAEAAGRTLERAYIDLEGKLIDYGLEIADLPDEKVTELIALLDDQNLAELEAELEYLSRTRRMRILLSATTAQNAPVANRSPGGGGLTPAQVDAVYNPDHLAHGTNSARGGPTIVGELGPELVNMPRGSTVKTAAETASILGGGGTTIYVNVAVDQLTDISEVGRKTVDALEAFYRNGGVAAGSR
jgi:hypothetical protein